MQGIMTVQGRAVVAHVLIAHRYLKGGTLQQQLNHQAASTRQM
jgi:hypothetical protein